MPTARRQADIEEKLMRWVKPAFTARRFGFEINLYINNR